MDRSEERLRCVTVWSTGSEGQLSMGDASRGTTKREAFCLARLRGRKNCSMRGNTWVHVIRAEFVIEAIIRLRLPKLVGMQLVLISVATLVSLVERKAAESVVDGSHGGGWRIFVWTRLLARPP